MRYPLQSPVVSGRKRFTSEELANLDVSCQMILIWRGLTPITDAQHEQVCSLMAAAPALLRALELGLRNIEDIESNDQLNEHEMAFAEAARAAIAKATGGSK